MKPGHIRVFDGMRITTEHMNHLQGSFHSALQDFRQIMGLGKVCYGFEVVGEGPGTITVKPGLAFDFQKNRVVCEEPKTLKIQWETADEKEKYVYIKYEQVEDGIIEGEPTLIWDSGTVLVRTGKPEPVENLVVIAKLTRKAGNAFEIVSLLADGQREKTGETQIEPPGEKENTAARETGKTGETGQPTNPGGETPGAEEPGPAVELTAEKTAEKEAKDEKAEIEKKSAGGIKLRTCQGVEYLPEGPGKEIHLGTLILEALKSKLSTRGKPGKAPKEDMLFTLAEKEVVLEAPSASLSSHTIIDFNLYPAGKGGKGTAAELPGTGKGIRYQATAQGEVTMAAGQITQFGISTIRYEPMGIGGNPRSYSGLTEQGIAHLDPGRLAKFIGKENKEIEMDMELLENIKLLVKVKGMETPGFKLICCLSWEGEVTEERINKLSENDILFTWKVIHAWKSLFSDSLD